MRRQVDSVFFQWTGPDMTGTMQIASGRPPLDQYLAAYERLTDTLFKNRKSRYDTCSSVDGFVKVIRHIHHRESDLLKTFASSLDPCQYDRAARDIYYNNMDIVISSRFFADLNAVRRNLRVPFPPITLNDSNVNHLTWHPEDSVAFATSFSYKGYMMIYMMNFEAVQSVWGFDKQSNDPTAYFHWLSGLINDKNQIDWLMAEHIYWIMIGLHPAMSVATLEGLFPLISNDKLHGELRSIRTSLDVPPKPRGNMVSY